MAKDEEKAAAAKRAAKRRAAAKKRIAVAAKNKAASALAVEPPWGVVSGELVIAPLAGINPTIDALHLKIGTKTLVSLDELASGGGRSVSFRLLLGDAERDPLTFNTAPLAARISMLQTFLSKWSDVAIYGDVTCCKPNN